MHAPSRGGALKSSFHFFVTSQLRHILSSGHSFLRAVCCMMAVRKLCGLKNPASHTEDGRLKSFDHASSSLMRISRSANHDCSPHIDGYARLVQLSGTWSKNSAPSSVSMSVVMVSSPFSPSSSSRSDRFTSRTSMFMRSHS
uniref:Uncharacterized protein n=1 Tax=Anopheles coluzzii TaxID=1518534 RepID=A0A8W7PMK6_ANOCL